MQSVASRCPADGRSAAIPALSGVLDPTSPMSEPGWHRHQNRPYHLCASIALPFTMRLLPFLCHCSGVTTGTKCAPGGSGFSSLRGSPGGQCRADLPRVSQCSGFSAQGRGPGMLPCPPTQHPNVGGSTCWRPLASRQWEATPCWPPLRLDKHAFVAMLLETPSPRHAPMALI